MSLWRARLRCDLLSANKSESVRNFVERRSITAGGRRNTKWNGHLVPSANFGENGAKNFENIVPQATTKIRGAQERWCTCLLETAVNVSASCQCWVEDFIFNNTKKWLKKRFGCFPTHYVLWKICSQRIILAGWPMHRILIIDWEMILAIWAAPCFSTNSPSHQWRYEQI